jgi:hypothetical protein
LESDRQCFSVSPAVHVFRQRQVQVEALPGAFPSFITKTGESWIGVAGISVDGHGQHIRSPVKKYPAGRFQDSPESFEKGMVKVPAESSNFFGRDIRESAAQDGLHLIEGVFVSGKHFIVNTADAQHDPNDPVGRI